MAIAAVSAVSCSKEETTYGTMGTMINLVYPTDGVFYHDTLQLPNIHCGFLYAHNSEKKCTSIKGNISGIDYDGNPWSEVVLYFDGKQIGTYSIPFLNIEYNLGTLDWDSEHPLRIMVYTPGRTDCYTTGFIFEPQSEGLHYRSF